MSDGASGAAGSVGGSVSGSASGNGTGGGGQGSSYNGNTSPSFGYGNTGFNAGQQGSIAGNTGASSTGYGVNGYAAASAPVTNGQVQGVLSAVPAYGTVLGALYGAADPNNQGIAFGVGGNAGVSQGQATQGQGTQSGNNMSAQQNINAIQSANPQDASLQNFADTAQSESLLNGGNPSFFDTFTGEGKRSTLASQQAGINQMWGATNPELYTQNSGTMSSRLAGQNAGDIARNAEQQAAIQGLVNARTAGMNPAQAALLGNQMGQQTYGQTYNSAYAQGLHDYLNQYNQATNTRSGLLGVAGQNASQQDSGLGANDYLNMAAGVANAASTAYNNSQGSNNNSQGSNNNSSVIGGGYDPSINAVGSDKILKDKIKGDKTLMDLVSKHVAGKQFNYKGSDTPVIGVMAQDMQKTPLKESVIPGDKLAVDNTKLSKQNIDLLISSISGIKEKLGRIKELAGI